MGSLSLRPGDLLTIPKMALSVGFIRFVSSTDATQAKGLLTFTPVGLPPTEHVCLSWTHSLPIIPSELWGAIATRGEEVELEVLLFCMSMSLVKMQTSNCAENLASLSQS